jgi:hypothetical protein
LSAPGWLKCESAGHIEIEDHPPEERSIVVVYRSINQAE